MKLEKRTAYFKSEFRVAEQTEDEKLYLEGYFIRYGQETELFEGCFEEVRKGAANDSIKQNDVRCLFNHDTRSVLGRTSNGTLALREDDKGVYGKVEINRNDPEAMSVYAKVQRGDIDACSFGFYVDEESSEKRDGGMKFFLEKIDVFEVSCVTFPAYPQTEIEARTNDINRLSKRSLEIKKSNLRERITNGIKANHVK